MALSAIISSLLIGGASAWSPTAALASAAPSGGLRGRCRDARLVTSASVIDDEMRRSVVFGDVPPTLSLVAPAKVNLFLRILRKREDGFHELASLFQTVSLFDDLDFWAMPREEGKPLCSMEVCTRP